MRRKRGVGLASSSQSMISLASVKGSAAELAQAVTLKLRELGEKRDVVRQTVAKWRAGTRKPDGATRRALEALWPTVTAAGWDMAAGASAPLPGDASEGGVVARVREWRRHGKATDAQLIEAISLELDAVRQRANGIRVGLSERTRALAAGGPYDILRARLLALEPGLAAVLPEPSSDPLEPARAEMREMLKAVSEPLAESISKHRLLDFRRLHRLSLQLERALGETNDAISDDGLLNSETLLALTAEIAGALQPEPAKRAAVIVGLRAEPRLAICDRVASELEGVRHLVWPSSAYANDSAGFCRDILGFDPWAGQERILEKVRENRQTAVRSGHKVGKTRIIAALVLWWFSLYEDARVVISNSTGKQLEDQDWAELKDLFNHSGRCLACTENDPKGPRPCPHSQVLDGDLLKTSRGGLTSKDGRRRVCGITARNTESLGGYSGNHLLVVIDEASSLEQVMFAAFVGNTAAAEAKFVMAGNPTRQTGPFFDAFHRQSAFWTEEHISSEEAAAAGVPGLADEAWCRMMAEQDERGKESPIYQIRVSGDFPKRAKLTIYALDDILGAQDEKRYDATPAEGRLVIAIDPAGETGFGDESIITAVRGFKVLAQLDGRGWNVEDHREKVIELLRAHAGPSERALVCIDADGVGANIARRLDWAAEHEHERIEILRVYFGQNARDWNEYDLVGDEAHSLASRWLAKGGVFPPNPKLEQELEIPMWIPVRRKRMERDVELRSATRKKDIRQIIHRSPDRMDCLRVFAWGAHLRGVLAGVAEQPVPAEAPSSAESFWGAEQPTSAFPWEQSMDPHGAMDEIERQLRR